MSLKSAIAAASLFLVTAVAQAEPVPVPWSFRAPSNESYFPDGATGGITFPNLALQAGGPKIAVATVAEWSIASAESPDRISGLAYQFAIELQDGLSGQTASLNFQGLLSGSYWRTGANLTNTFTGSSTQSVELGGNRYTVSLEGFESPTGYGDELAGRILAGVQITDLVQDGGPGGGPVGGGSGNGPLDPTATPEPTTLLLAAIGLPMMGLVTRRRNRRQPEPQRP